LPKRDEEKGGKKQFAVRVEKEDQAFGDQKAGKIAIASSSSEKRLL